MIHPDPSSSAKVLKQYWWWYGHDVKPVPPLIIWFDLSRSYLVFEIESGNWLCPLNAGRRSKWLWYFAIMYRVAFVPEQWRTARYNTPDLGRFKELSWWLQKFATDWIHHDASGAQFPDLVEPGHQPGQTLANVRITCASFVDQADRSTSASEVQSESTIGANLVSEPHCDWETCCSKAQGYAKKKQGTYKGG